MCRLSLSMSAPGRAVRRGWPIIGAGPGRSTARRARQLTTTGNGLSSSKQRRNEMIALIIVLAVVVLLVIIGIGVYNGLVVKRNRVRNGWSQIDVQLKRRIDLIPNLVEARSLAINAKGPAESARANNALTDTLKTLFAVAENYPNLKANENFAKL